MRTSTNEKDRNEIVSIKFELISVRNSPPPWEFKRTIVFNKKVDLYFVHETLIYKLLKFTESHAYAFYLKSEPFSSTDGEYGSPRDEVWNLAEYSFRELHFYLKNVFSERTSEITQENIQNTINEFYMQLNKVGPRLPDLKNAKGILLEDLNLQVGQTFYYVFDFGDLWTFQGTVVPTPENVDYVAPSEVQVVEAKGEPLPQYYNIEEGEIYDDADFDEFDVFLSEKITERLLREKGKKYCYHVKNGTISFYRSATVGSVIVFIEIKLAHQQPKTLAFLVDLFKIGLKDFFMYPTDFSTVKSYFQDHQNEMTENDHYMTDFYDDENFYDDYDNVEFISIKKEEALDILARGLAIAQKIGTPTPPKAKKWLRYLNIKTKNLKGSLYKCYRCEKGELTKKQVSKIIKIAKKDLHEGVAGTPLETQEIFLCKACDKEMKRKTNLT